jgi:nucleoside-diphosphate-sugar epimerase
MISTGGARGQTRRLTTHDRDSHTLCEIVHVCVAHAAYSGSPAYAPYSSETILSRMASALILGGTRNLGHFTALSLLEAGHDVTILNRGRTADDLPPDVKRIRADRNDDASMRAAIGAHSFDIVLDNTTYTERDAQQAVDLFSGRVGRYVFISSGQVYLVRENLPRPFRETDYFGPVMTSPATDSADHSSWLYGIDKRLAEQVFLDGVSSSEFPVITLRLPMVASERDHYGRIQGYIARLMDGGPLLIPEEPGLPLRHVYVNDVARLITRLIALDIDRGKPFNISYGESLTLDAFLDLLASIAGSESQILRVDRSILEERGLLPDCSPFSGRWMSELDNSLSVADLGAEYTPPTEYLPSIVDDFARRWKTAGLIPDSYRQRNSELSI